LYPIDGKDESETPLTESGLDNMVEEDNINSRPDIAKVIEILSAYVAKLPDN
jgi:hypothetical protein